MILALISTKPQKKLLCRLGISQSESDLLLQHLCNGRGRNTAWCQSTNRENRSSLLMSVSAASHVFFARRARNKDAEASYATYDSAAH
eukprot:6176920-Pleurochrysis_carterae.AAC.1